jgi:predicted transport protein
MPDLKIFRVDAGVATEVAASGVALERSLQRLIETNMETVFGVRFLSSEYSTGTVHRGRIDSLGLDENNSPVIFEYKRSTSENVINQGLFYLDWLVDHKAEFQLLVQERLGGGEALAIDWSSPRLVCVARDFTRYDEHAVRQIDRNVGLVRYSQYGENLLAVELVTAVSSPTTSTSSRSRRSIPMEQTSEDAALETAGQSGLVRAGTSVGTHLARASEELAGLFKQYEQLALAQGDDVDVKENHNYFAFRRLKNFACVEVHNSSGNLLVYLKVNPDSINLIEGFSRDVRGVGHFGTGSLELRLTDTNRWALVEEYTTMSYIAS